MKKLIFLVAIQIAFLSHSFSQSRNVEWEKTYKQWDLSIFTDMVESDNSGYAILGSVKNNNTLEPYLIFLNEFGEFVWEKIFNTTANMYPKCIVKCGKSGYMLAGLVKPDQEPEKIFMIKTNTTGDELWRKEYKNEGHCLEGKMILLKDHNFLMAGTIQPEEGNQFIKLIKIDSVGNIVWENTFQDKELVSCKSIKQLNDGTLVLAQEVVMQGKNNSDIQVTHINESGEVIWNSRIPGKDSKSWPECICPSEDNCLYIAGWHGIAFNDINSENPIIDYDLFVCKMDQNGKLLWTKNFDSEGSEGGNNISSGGDGTFWVAGKKETSFTGKIGPWILHLDNDGKIIEDISIPFHFNNDQAVKIINTSDGGFIVIGPGNQPEENSRAFAWVIKYAAL